MYIQKLKITSNGSRKNIVIKNLVKSIKLPLLIYKNININKKIKTFIKSKVGFSFFKQKLLNRRSKFYLNKIYKINLTRLYIRLPVLIFSIIKSTFNLVYLTLCITTIGIFQYKPFI
jgi:hypothetical protein